METDRHTHQSVHAPPGRGVGRLGHVMFVFALSALALAAPSGAVASPASVPMTFAVDAEADVVDPAERVLAPLPESDGCELPPADGGLVLVFPQVGADGLFQIPASTGQPHLVISCLEFDRAAYREGETWGASLTVTNAGNAASSPISIYAQLCRHMSDGVAFSCTVGVFALASSEPPLEAGESRVLDHPAAFAFAALDTDPPDEYESWIDGLPDNGTIYLRASVASLGEYTMASAIYPSGPQAPAPAPGAVDADEDGYVLPGDCNDNNPGVHEGATDLVGNGIDEDCAGGDASCTEGLAIYHNQCVESVPGQVADPQVLDLDGDGFSVAEGDCDDDLYNVHPGAIELQDGLDNNCNGETDEVLGVPDFTLTAEVAEGTSPHPYVGGVLESGLHYTVEVQNLGAGIPIPIENIQAVSAEAEGVFGPVVLSTGTSGFIPFRQIPFIACAGGPLRFRIEDNGIFGETNFANNMVELTYEGQGLPSGVDRDVRFDDTPTVLYDDDPTALSVYASRVAEGTCPPMPTDGLGLMTMFSAHHRVWLNGDLIHDVATFNEVTSVALPDRLHRHDRVCAEVTLNDPYIVAEGAANNRWVGAYEFRHRLFSPGELQLVDSAIGVPDSSNVYFGSTTGISCAAWSAGESDMPIAGATTSALTGSGSAAGPWLGGIGGALVIGALGAGLGLLARRRVPGLSLRSIAAAGGVAGVVVGGVAGSWLVANIANAAREPATVRPPAGPGEMVTLPSCDAYLDTSSASPADGAVFLPGGSLLLDLDPMPGADPKPDAYRLSVIGPGGQSFSSSWEAEGGDPASLDLVQAAYRYPGSFSFPPGEYAWSIDFGQHQGDTLCRNSASHTFVVEELTSGPAPLRDTPTPSAIATPTWTPKPPTTTPASRPPTETATTVPDTQGPSIKSVSDSPDPIKVTQPKGCSPTTSVVTASISDPSGVASASVLFFHTTIGQVPMTNAGGNTWAATLGPFSATGDGTVDYQIRATDGRGNTTDSAFSQVTVLACLP